jgi:hypothetical protein
MLTSHSPREEKKFKNYTMDSTSAKALGIVLQVSTKCHQKKIEALAHLKREAAIGKLFMKLISIEHLYFRSMMRLCAINDDGRCHAIGYIGALCSDCSFPRHTSSHQFTFELVRENVLAELFQLCGFKVSTYSNMPLDNDLAMIHILDWSERTRFQHVHGYEDTTGPDGKVYFREILPAEDSPNPQKWIDDKYN